MALIFTDGFDSYAATADLAKKWFVVGTGWTWTAGAGRFSGPAVSNAGGGAANLLQSYNNLLTTGEYAVGFYLKVSAPPASSQVIFRAFALGGTPLSSLRVNTAGTMSLWSNNDGTNYATGTRNVCDNQWHWIEARMLHAFQGLYIDNINECTGLGAENTANNYFALCSMLGVTATVDDLVVYDNTAGAPVSTTAWPLSARQITTLRPTADGTCTFSTLSSGTAHFSLVNEVNPDTTSWVSDLGGAGHQDLYSYGALGYTPSTITAVMVNNYPSNPGGGTINFQSACKSGATTGLGPSTVTPLTSAIMQTPFGVDPNTSATWTPTALGSAQFGIKAP